MKCTEVRNKLIFYYYKELPQAQMLKIKEHLDQCQSCRLEYNKLALVLDYADKEAQARPQKDIWQEVSKEITSSSTTVVRRLRVFEAIAIAASIAIAAFIGSWTGRVYVSSVNNQSEYSTQTAEYDSLVNTFEYLDENIALVIND